MKNIVKFLLPTAGLLLMGGQFVTATTSVPTTLPTFTYSGVTYMVTPGGCTDSKTPTCSGGLDKLRETWNDGGREFITIGATSTTDGAANTTKLANYTNQVHYAAKYCDDMVYAGYDDWFLPAVDELRQVLSNNANITGIQKGNYWSSTEDWSTSARMEYSSIIGTYQNATKSNGYYVRCIRKSTGATGNQPQISGTNKSSSGVTKSVSNTRPSNTLSAFSYNGRVYMVTPGGCTDSKTPTCSGEQDTVMKNWTSAKRYCADMVYGGYNDWVLPGDNSLEGLNFFTQMFETRYAIGGFRNDNYWTSKDLNGKYYFTINMSDSQSDFDTGKALYYVRCVRKTGTNNLPFFSHSGSKYMVTPGGCTDSKTTTCSGSTDILQKSWNSAKKYCDDMVYGGYNDWFLPLANQLDSMIRNYSAIGGIHGIIPGYAGDDYPSAYWSSTEVDSSNARTQHADYSSYSKKDLNYFRCIRKAQ